VSAKFDNKIPQVIRVIDKDASALVRKTALGVEASIKQEMTAPKHGRTYRRRGRTHTASARGEAPAVESGALVNSIATAMDGDYAAEVGTPQEYGPNLETTLDRPAFKHAAKKAEKIFERNVKRLR
jgi:phage gpG-like protein